MLHLEPEKVTSRIFRDRIGIGQDRPDALRTIYPHVDRLRMFLPEEMDIFPAHCLDLPAHNHGLGHITGRYQEALLRSVKVGAMMIFSVPSPWHNVLTDEGGEHLATDDEGVAHFGEANHLKRFGHHLPQWLHIRPAGEFV